MDSRTTNPVTSPEAKSERGSPNQEALPRSSRLLSWIGRWHGRLVFERRSRVLAEMLAALIPKGASVLDVGCGDGTIGARISQLRPDLFIRGAEVLVRAGCKIACSAFDGTKLPFADGSFDVCMMVDVLHHAVELPLLLCEAARVSSSLVLIKDHLRENFVDGATLRFMDWVGNRPHGVRLQYNYPSRGQWIEYFSRCGLSQESWTTSVPLYPPPFSLVAGRRLHFVTALSKSNVQSK